MIQFDLTAARARIAWLSPDPDALESARGVFAAAGYALTDITAPIRPDLAVIDLRARGLSPKAVKALADLTRQAAPDCGLVYTAPVTLTAAERAHLRRSGDLVLTGEDLAPAVETCRARLRLRAVAEETGERLKSLAATTRLSAFPPIEAATRPPSVLIAGEAGPTAMQAIAAAEAVAGESYAVLSAAQAMRALEAHAFDCAVLMPRGPGDPLMGLARSMRRHRRFQDLPLILVGGDGFGTERWRLSGAYVAETLLARHAGDDLGGRILAASRRARLAAAMRRFLNACAGDGVRDRMSGAFAPGFFAPHAERLFARADDTGRPLSVVGLRLAPVQADEAQVPASQMLAEAARLVKRVTRAEDFVARLTSDTFIVLMPATQARDARAAAARVSGVIANTMFRTGIECAPFAVAASTAVIGRERGGRLDETVAQAFAALNRAAPVKAER